MRKAIYLLVITVIGLCGCGSKNEESRIEESKLPSKSELITNTNSDTGNSYNGPFGLQMGLSLKEIGGDPVEAAPGKYKLTKLPKSHSSFEYYLVQVSPKQGLCWIKAVGKDIQTNSHGLQLKSEFDSFVEKLDKLYGKNELINMLLPGSIWDDPEDFMMGLLKKDRYLLAGWKPKDGAVITDNISQVGLLAAATDTNTGYITLEYYFTNNLLCDAELSEQDDSAL